MVIVTKVTKAKQLAKVAAGLKETLLVFADKRKKKTLRTIIQGDTSKITSGQRGATPLPHREGLSCAEEVPSNCGSSEGELLLLKKTP